jgi:hypothetical protein
MNKILGAVIAFVAGSTVGFLTAKVVYTKYYENLIDGEIESVRNAYDIALMKLKSDMKQEMKQQVADCIEKQEPHHPIIQRTNKSAIVRDEEVPEGNQYNNAIQYYNGLTDINPEEGEELDEEVNEEYLDDTAYGEPVEQANPYPYTISEAAFNHDMVNYEKFLLEFYMKDKVLVDEDNAEIEKEDVVSMIGSDNHLFLCTNKRDAVIYVRNEVTQCDFEIATLDEYFHVTKQNTEVPMTPREAYDARQKKRSEGK